MSGLSIEMNDILGKARSRVASARLAENGLSVSIRLQEVDKGREDVHV